MHDLTMLIWLTQLGLSVAAPLIAFPLLGSFLCSHFGWGRWVFWLLLTIGVFSAFEGLLSALKSMERLSRRKKKQDEQDEPPLAFSEHD